MRPTTSIDGPEIGAVRSFRKRSIDNGFKPVRVYSAAKLPVAKAWPLGEEEEQLLAVDAVALNTGILAAGLRGFDLDIDEPSLARFIEKCIRDLYPGAIVRRRANSPRTMIVVRAAVGLPSKHSIAGPNGKLEVLGAGQQFVAHGVHPTGAPIEWENGRGPDTVARDQLPAATEDQINGLLNACAPLLGSTGVATGPATVVNVFEQPFTPPSVVFNSATPIENELGAGIEPVKWFGALPVEEKSACIRACLDAIDNRTDDSRERWLRIIFAAADAGRFGCPDARELVLDWSRRGRGWTSDADFDTAWDSAKPGPIGVGTLLAAAKQADLDLSPWRDFAVARLQSASGLQSTPSAPPVTALVQQQQRAMHVSALPRVPEKREWVHGTDAMRGAVTLFVAPGARGKSSWLVILGLACASGRPLLGAHVSGGPLRVLILSAEDPEAEVARRVRAAMQHYGLKDSDVPGLYVIGADKWGLPLLSSAGNIPVPDERGWSALNAEIERTKPDILVVDPQIAVMGGVNGNDNSAAAVLMGKWVKLAADRRMAVVAAHHAAKGRDPTSQDSAMGAATFVNLARIVLTIEPLSEKDAGRIGLPPWDAKPIFRVLGVKQNFSPAAVGDRWFRQVSVELNNARPPVYPSGDKVGVVEPFQPGSAGPAYDAAVLGAALTALDTANPPLSPSKRATGRYAVDTIAQAIAPHRGGKVSDTEAAAVLDHIIRSGLAAVQRVKIARPGGRADERNGLVVTSLGKAALQPAPASAAPAATPHPPQQSRGNNAGPQDGGGPKGPRNVPRGGGGNAGEKITGAATPTSNNNNSKTACERPAAASAPAACDIAASALDSPAIVPAGENDLVNAEPAPDSARSPEPPPNRPVVDDRRPGPLAPVSTAPSNHPSPDDLSIPDFLRR